MTPTWITFLDKPKTNEPIAIIGSPGLRSVGKLVIDYLSTNLKTTLFAELYSSHLPLIYQTSPSYASSPNLPGEAGVKIHHRYVGLPKIDFYYLSSPELIIVNGYHPNFYGQYEVAENVLDLIEEFGTKKMIVIAGSAREGEDVCCAVTNLNMLEELKRYDISIGYVGPFYGFSGLVFGLASLRSINAVCLFGRTKPNPEYPEDPDSHAAKMVLEKIGQMLQIDLDLASL